MPNRRQHDHLVSNKFRVEIDGVTQGAFAAVSGLESTTDVVTYADGSDLLVRKRPGRTNYSNVVLRRGYLENDELWQWYKAVADGAVERKAGSIIALADNGDEILRYNFFEAWPCRWQGFTLDASAPGTLVEEVEMVVEKIERG